MGNRMAEMRNFPAELGYFQAATALRPEVGMAHHNFGRALECSNRPQEAVVQYRLAIRCDPTCTAPKVCLGVALVHTGHLEQGIAQIKEAMRDDPTDVEPYTSLGAVLSDAGRNAEALEMFRHAVAMKPTGSTLAVAQHSLFIVLYRLGRLDESLGPWEEQLSSRPTEHGPWDGYAEYCAFLGREAEYRRARESLLDLFGNSTDPRECEVTARACLLMPASGDELRRATAMIDRALATEPSMDAGFSHYYLFAKGLAEYRAGHFESALSIMTGKAARVLGPAPGLVAAMAQWRLGNVDPARQTLARAVGGFNWDLGTGGNSQEWMYHALRREAAGLIVPNPPAPTRATSRPG